MEIIGIKFNTVGKMYYFSPEGKAFCDEFITVTRFETGRATGTFGFLINTVAAAIDPAVAPQGLHSGVCVGRLGQFCKMVL